MHMSKITLLFELLTTHQDCLTSPLKLLNRPLRATSSTESNIGPSCPTPIWKEAAA